jgi:hypothetical protein
MYRANVLGHTGRAVCPQAAEDFNTRVIQPMSDESNTWRGRAETYQINR